MRIWAVWVGVGFLAVGCSKTTAPRGRAAAAATVIVEPSLDSIAAGITVQMTDTVRDSTGRVLTNVPVTWSATPTAVATVSATGLVTAVVPGLATVTATAGTVHGDATIVVQAPGSAAVASAVSRAPCRVRSPTPARLCLAQGRSRPRMRVAS